jgi:hypothetical protein
VRFIQVVMGFLLMTTMTTLLMYAVPSNCRPQPESHQADQQSDESQGSDYYDVINQLSEADTDGSREKRRASPKDLTGCTKTCEGNSLPFGHCECYVRSIRTSTASVSRTCDSLCVQMGYAAGYCRCLS